MKEAEVHDILNLILDLLRVNGRL